MQPAIICNSKTSPMFELFEGQKMALILKRWMNFNIIMVQKS